MIAESNVPVLLFDDGVLDVVLRQALATSGFQLLQVADVEAGLQFLRENPGPVVALFRVSLEANMLNGLDQVTLLGELLRDETLSRRHAFMLVTPTPHEIRMALGRVLQRTHVTVLAQPLDRERLLAATWLANQRIAPNDAAKLSTPAR